MRPDIVAGAVFPDYELYDHTAKRIECSLLAGTFFSSRARGCASSAPSHRGS